MSSVWGRFVKRSVSLDYVTFCCFVCSKLFFCAKQRGVYVVKAICVLNDSNMASSDVNENVMPKT